MFIYWFQYTLIIAIIILFAHIIYDVRFSYDNTGQ